jgi:hypothetical protein
MPSKRAAIDPDEILSRSLAEISAADFVQLLVRDDVNVDSSALALLPDKKKYELWVDEEVVLKTPLSDLLVTLKTEKKKLELEKFPIENLKLAVENVVDPGVQYLDPQGSRAMLVDQIANAVARKLRG